VIREGIKKLTERVSLTEEESEQIMKEIMSGEATPAQIAAFLVALRMKGETVDEVASFVKVMRQFCVKLNPKVNGRIVDIVGTGGDRLKTINVSTAAAIVAAGAGVTVAKHGNRSFTGKCGAADLLERLGVNLESDPALVERSIEEVGIGFMFAPRFHKAMRHVVGARREIGVRTVFNILGPLTNPAGADAQVVGVYDEELVKPVAGVLAKLGLKEALVVHGLDGLDEVSTVGLTYAAWLKDGVVRDLYLKPKDFGVGQTSPEEILGSGVEENAECIFKILTGHPEVNERCRELILVNSAVGIVVGGRAEGIREGMELADESLESGAAYRKLKSMVKVCGGDISKLEEFESRFL